MPHRCDPGATGTSAHSAVHSHTTPRRPQERGTPARVWSLTCTHRQMLKQTPFEADPIPQCCAAKCLTMGSPVYRILLCIMCTCLPTFLRE